MRVDASVKRDLLHIDAMLTTLERMATRGDSLASTSLISEPGYWRKRIEALLAQHGIVPAEREHALALLQRLNTIVSLSSEDQPGGVGHPTQRHSA